jgi:tetratricopeptide (TPR) repeat protein
MTIRHNLVIGGAAFSMAALVLCIAFGAGCGRSLDLEASKKFQDAQEIYNLAEDPEDFLRAASLYEQILDEGIENGAVLYNLGNAYMQADERGRAIAAYRKAKRYLPRDPFLDANLDYALGDRVPNEGRQSILDHVLFWKDWLSYPEKYSLFTGAAGLCLLLALIALYSPKPRMWKRILSAVLVISVFLGFAAGYDTYRFAIKKHGVIIVDDVIARKGNSETYEPSFTDTLAEGKEFEILDERSGWYLVRIPEGPEGWIPAQDATTY